MTALTTDRNTPEHGGVSFSHPVAAGYEIFAGSIVVVGSISGFAMPGITATTVKAVGRAEEHVDNSSGADGDVSVTVKRGVFRFENDGSAINRGDIGKTAYVVDDQTVAATDGAGTRGVAGIIEDVDLIGVWVRI